MERGGSLDNGDLRMYTKTVGNTPTGEAKLHDYSFWKGSAHRDGKVQHAKKKKRKLAANEHLSPLPPTVLSSVVRYSVVAGAVDSDYVRTT